MKRFLKSLIFYITLNLAVFSPLLVRAAMSSTSYKIQWDTVGVGGEDTSSSASYKVRDSLEFIQGVGTSSSYRVDSGYRGGIYDPIVHFNVVSQDTATQVAATSITNTSVDVTTTTGYAVGDYIVVVQNEGLNQVEAMGKVTSVSGSTLNVDYFQYANSLPAVDSTNDYVYELAGSSVPLASLTPHLVSTGVIGWEVDADVPIGYDVFIREDHDLKTSGSDVINDVDDGEVTMEIEEYGGRSSDLTLAGSTFDTADTAFTTTFQKVASRSVATLKARDFLTLKAAAASTTIDGAYSHTLTLVFVGNY